MADDLKKTIRDNVRALLKIPGGESGVAKVMALGYSNGTAQRILDNDSQIQVDTLDSLAGKLGVTPWQLCVPGLEPDRLPQFERAEFRWPFQRIDPDVITGLVGSPAAAVENGLLVALASVGISPRKRDGTNG